MRVMRWLYIEYYTEIRSPRSQSWQSFSFTKRRWMFYFQYYFSSVCPCPSPPSISPIKLPLREHSAVFSIRTFSFSSYWPVCGIIKQKQIQTPTTLGFYTAFSTSTILYINLMSGQDSEQGQGFIQLVCGYEISLRLLVIYWWFNTFFINVHFRELRQQNDADILSTLVL